MKNSASVMSEKIYAEQTRLLFKAAKTSVVGTFLGILFSSLVLWQTEAHDAILIWAMLFVTVNVLRGLHAYLYSRLKEHQSNHHWSRQFAVGTMLAALCWGGMAVTFFSSADFEHQLILTFIITVANTIAITNVSVFRHIIISFIALSMLPVSVEFCLGVDPLGVLVGVMTAGSMLLFMLGANRVYRSTYENIRLRLKAVGREESLRVSQQRLNLHVERTPLAVIEWDDAFNIVEWNQAAAKIFGYKAEEVLGRNGLELLVPEQQAMLVGEAVELLQERSGGNYLVNENITKSGEIILCEWFNTELIDKQGNFIGLASLVHDITSRAHADRLKNEFISTVSHELRTPLTSLRGSLGLILGGVAGEIPKKIKELVKVADSNSNRLLNLINDLLDIQKIESGLVEYNFEVVGLSQLMALAVAENKGYAAQRNIVIRMDDKAGEAMVSVDEAKLQQVMANLLSNAVKFSPEESVVDIIITRQGDKVRVAVMDEGVGVDDEFVDRLFEKFSQADSTDARSHAGTGLGLSIAQAIARDHHSEIIYQPRESGGSCFYFDLALVG